MKTHMAAPRIARFHFSPLTKCDENKSDCFSQWHSDIVDPSYLDRPRRQGSESGGLFPISRIELEYAIFLKVANPFDPQWKRYFLERAFVVKVRLINLIDLRSTGLDEIDGKRLCGHLLSRERG